MTHLLTLAMSFAMFLQQPPARPKAADLPDSPAFKERGAKITLIGKNVWVDGNENGRRVLVRGTICRDRVDLEEFMCLKGTKEHESIVTADLVPKVFQAALLAADAEPGAPAKIVEGKFFAPTGGKIEITVEWKAGKEFKRARAQDWIRDVKSKKAITHDFVFAGSQWITNPVNGEKFFLGDEGDLVSVANFSGSIIDLAVQSSNENQSLDFETFTERIPAVDTEVTVILKAVKKDEKSAAQKPTGDAKK